MLFPVSRAARSRAEVDLGAGGIDTLDSATYPSGGVPGPVCAPESYAKQLPHAEASADGSVSICAIAISRVLTKASGGTSVSRRSSAKLHRLMATDWAVGDHTVPGSGIRIRRVPATPVGAGTSFPSELLRASAVVEPDASIAQPKPNTRFGRRTTKPQQNRTRVATLWFTIHTQPTTKTDFSGWSCPGWTWAAEVLRLQKID